MSAPKDQHFLVDQRAVEKIAGFVDVSGRRVLEIGPGEGVLTRALLGRGATVVAVEVDPALVEELEFLFADEIAEGVFSWFQAMRRRWTSRRLISSSQTSPTPPLQRSRSAA